MQLCAIATLSFGRKNIDLNPSSLDLAIKIENSLLIPLGAILWSEAPLVRGSFGPSFYENTRNLDPSAQRTFSSVKVAKFRRVFGPIL